MTEEARKVRDKLAIQLVDELFYARARRKEILYVDILDTDVFKAGFDAGYEYERARSDKLIEALKWIGDEDNYFGTDVKDAHGVHDLQRKAREAIADIGAQQ